jgi:hypothetical protein
LRFHVGSVLILGLAVAAMACGTASESAEGQNPLAPLDTAAVEPQALASGEPETGAASPDEVRPLFEEGIEEDADAVLRAAGALLASAQRFTFHADIMEEEFLASGHMVDSTRDGDIAVRRPNGLFVDRRAAGRHRQLFYDGASVAIVDIDANLYVQRTEDVPAELDEFLDMLVEVLDVPIPLADVIVADPYASFVSSARVGVHLGTSRLRGVNCHHLAFNNGEIEWQLWIARDGPALLHKVVIHYTDEPGTPRWEAHLTRWNLDADIPDERFTFTPPEGAHKIELVGREYDAADVDGDSADDAENE